MEVDELGVALPDSVPKVSESCDGRGMVNPPAWLARAP
jgi:hypothetical protein